VTTLHTASKSDTALLLDLDYGAIEEDLGPARTDLTNNITYLAEANSARVALAVPRTITVIVNMKSTDSGTLIELGIPALASWRIASSGSTISFVENSSTRLSVTTPGLIVSNRKIMIHWSVRTDGSSNQSDVWIYNFTTAEWSYGMARHVVYAPVASHTLTVGGRAGGLSLYTGGLGAFFVVHVGRRFRSGAEAKEDFVGQSTPATSTGYDRSPFITGPSSALAIAGEANLCGPSLMWAGAATRQAGQRGVGPLVNVSIRSPYAEPVTGSPTRFYRAAPDDAAWQWCVRYLWHAYIGPKVNVAHVRIHLRAYDSGGGVTISPISFRAYSVADLPLAGSHKPLTDYRGPSSTVSAVSSAGVWVDLGVVRLARDAEGMSYFLLGWDLVPAVNEGAVFATLWKLNAITVEPFAKNLEGGGMGGDLDKESP
jgi:hypothetical protein